jgi:hypothetical protein
MQAPSCAALGHQRDHVPGKQPPGAVPTGRRAAGSGLGVHRWVVEGTIALLHWFRRLRIRWEIRDDIHQAFATPGGAIICW